MHGGASSAAVCAVAAAAAVVILSAHLRGRRRRHASARETTRGGGAPRLVTSEDYENLVRQLRKRGEADCLPPPDSFAQQLVHAEGEMLQRSFLIEDERGMPVAAASLLVEAKCLRGGGSVAHVYEWLSPTKDDDAARIALLTHLVDVARAEGCYKLLADVPPHEDVIHRSCGLAARTVMMCAELSGGRGARGAQRTPAGAASCVPPRRPSPVMLCASGQRQAAGYLMRPLTADDSCEAYLALLGQLTQAPPISANVFHRQLARMERTGGMHTVLVVAADADASPSASRPQSQPPSRSLIACATLILERLPLGMAGRRDATLIGRIEDVVVDSSARGTGLGRAMMRALLQLAAQSGASAVLLKWGIRGDRTTTTRLQSHTPTHVPTNSPVGRVPCVAPPSCTEEKSHFYAKAGFDWPRSGEAGYAVYLGLGGVAPSSATLIDASTGR